MNGGHAISYDGDLLTQAGEFARTPHASHGLLAATEPNNVATAHTYNAFGEARAPDGTLLETRGGPRS